MSGEIQMLCPNCGKKMVLRTGRRGQFWGCTGFPVCRFTKDYVEQVKTTKKFEPSKYQQAVFEFIKEGTGNAVIKAVAGSGKTTTIVEALQYTKGKVVFLAFNKKIATELSRRAPMWVNCSTLHSLGFKTLNNTLPARPLVDDDKKPGIAKELFPRDEDRMLRSALCRLASLCQNTLTDPNDRQAVQELIDRYSVDIPTNGNNEEERVLQALPKMIQECASRTGVVDYDDMIWLPVFLGLAVERFGWVFVDETQDVNAAQLELIKRSIGAAGRMVAVGDDHQCQPEGTLVYKTGVGYVPIESVHPGDELMTYLDGYFAGKNAQGRKVQEVAFRKYTGDLVHIQAGGYSHDVTPEHRCVIRMAKRNGWAVYVLLRGTQARVGTTKSANNPAGSVGLRARQEKADCAWILGIFDNREDAYLLESRVAYQYGIPQVCFQRKWEVSDTTIHVQEWLDKFWAFFSNNTEGLLACLKEFGRDVRYPFWEATKNGGEFGKKRGSLYISVTQACNLISGWMRVCTYDGNVHAKESGWKEVQISRCEYSGLVYSLKLEPRWRSHPVYVAQGIVTHNSIYGFRGADTEAIPKIIAATNATTLPLSVTYRCPISHVKLARFLVPELEPFEHAKDGEVVENYPEHKMIADAKDGDLVLCRTNAPLVRVCYAIIRSGKKATIAGRDIGKGLQELIDKMAAANVPDLMAKIRAYKEREIAKLEKAGKENRIAALEDKIETLMALTEGVADLSELRANIGKIFTDDVAGTVCSSVHRAKGLEAETVYIIEPGLLPFPKAKKDWEIVQERNILYVALTRSKNRLVFVGGPIPAICRPVEGILCPPISPSAAESPKPRIKFSEVASVEDVRRFVSEHPKHLLTTPWRQMLEDMEGEDGEQYMMDDFREEADYQMMDHGGELDPDDLAD